MEYPKTPTLDKMKSVKDNSQAIGEFLEWLEGKKYCVAHYDDSIIGRDELSPVTGTTEELLAKFFDIDLKKAEEEKRAVLEYVRNQNKENKNGHD